jgi:predicted nucleic acid-binding protein
MKNYCLDTNVFIEAWNKYYSQELCPDYWNLLESLAEQKTIFCPVEVRYEIEQIDDELAAWVKRRPYLFKDVTDRVNHHMRSIMSTYPRLVDSTRKRSMADPWVIAHAIAENAVVVTKEVPAGDHTPRVKIPDVCNALGVAWMNDFDFLDTIGVRFSAQLQKPD